MNFVTRLFGYLQSNRDRGDREVRLVDGGFAVYLNGKPHQTVEWADVAEIVAFKRDLFSYDEICLGFRIRGGAEFARVGEEDQGFNRLCEATKAQFPGIKKDWYKEVAAHAFHENWTRIWGHQLSTPASDAGVPTPRF